MNRLILLAGAASSGSSPEPTGHSFLIVGDSIAYGLVDTAQDGGYLKRIMVANDWEFTNVAGPGSTTGNALNEWVSLGIADTLPNVTDAVFEHGTNDVHFPSATAAGVKGGFIEIWVRARNTGKRSLRIYQTSVVPRTEAGTDTPWEAEPIRQDVNAWLADGAPLGLSSGSLVARVTGSVAPSTMRAGEVGHPLTKVLPVHTLSEEGDHWKTGFVNSDDGVHPNPYGHEQIALGLTPYFELDTDA